MADAVSDRPASPSPTRRALLRVSLGSALAGAFGGITVEPTAAQGIEQEGWFLCPKCQGLYFGDPGKCPAGSGHAGAGVEEFALYADFTPPYSYYQAGWRYCRKCLGLHYPRAGTGACPAGGKHAAPPSGDYQLRVGRPSAADYEGAWHYCTKCHGPWHAGNRTKGRCPEAGGHKRPAGSKGYSLFRI